MRCTAWRASRSTRASASTRRCGMLLTARRTATISMLSRPRRGLCWTDTSVNHERVAALGPLQKLNHFVDMILQEGSRRMRLRGSLPAFCGYVEVFYILTLFYIFTFLRLDYNLKLLKLLRSGQAKSHRGGAAHAPLF